MVDWSWIPGLPSLGSTVDVWVAYPDEMNDEHLFTLAVIGDKKAITIDNSQRNAVALDDYVFVRRDHEKQYTELQGRRLPIKQWSLEKSSSAPEPNGDDVRAPPRESVPVAPRQSELDELEQYL